MYIQMYVCSYTLYACTHKHTYVYNLIIHKKTPPVSISEYNLHFCDNLFSSLLNIPECNKWNTTEVMFNHLTLHPVLLLYIRHNDYTV